MSEHTKLTLTDKEGVVIETWTIGKEVEYNIEDLDYSNPEHDFYADEDHSDFEDLGKEILLEVRKHFHIYK